MSGKMSIKEGEARRSCPPGQNSMTSHHLAFSSCTKSTVSTIFT